jgi:hypothetical protein
LEMWNDLVDTTAPTYTHWEPLDENCSILHAMTERLGALPDTTTKRWTGKHRDKITVSWNRSQNQHVLSNASISQPDRELMRIGGDHFMNVDKSVAESTKGLWQFSLPRNVKYLNDGKHSIDSCHYKFQMSNIITVKRPIGLVLAPL